MEIVKKFVLGQMNVNCFLIKSNDNYILIDAPAAINRVTNYLDKENIKLDYLLITHTHFDHIMGIEELVQGGYINKVYVAPKEIDLVLDNSKLGNMGEYFDVEIIASCPILSLEQIDTSLLGLKIKYIEGHSKQSAVFIFEKAKTIFSGDTLFKNSIGRSDFAYGNIKTLQAGIIENIMSYDDFTVYPGHGFATNTELERNNNLIYN